MVALGTTYRIQVIWAPILNRTPHNKYSNTTPVKNPVLPQKLGKIRKIAAKFELNPTQKTILKNKTPGFKLRRYGKLIENLVLKFR